MLFLAKDNANLISIIKNNKQLENFDPNNLNYKIDIDYKDSWPNIEFKTNTDENVFVNFVLNENKYSRIYTIYVTGENNKIKTYKLTINKIVSNFKIKELQFGLLPIGYSQKANLNLILDDDTVAKIEDLESLEFLNENNQKPNYVLAQGNYLFGQMVSQENIKAKFKYKSKFFETNLAQLKVLNSIEEKKIIKVETPSIDVKVNQKVVYLIF